MNLVRDLPLNDADGDFHVVVETPGMSKVKLRYDDTLEMFVWSRPLTLGLEFPYDFGFFPRTVADDGDPLDAIVLTDQPTFPGVVVPARVIGALRLEQRRGSGRTKRNDRVLVVPVDEHRSAHVADVRQLPVRVLSEIEEFFRASVALTHKVIRLRGWAGTEEARKLVHRAAARFSRDGA